MLNVYGVGVSFRLEYSSVGNLSVASVGEERTKLSASVYLLLQCMYFLFGEFFLPPDAWDGLRYFIVALPGPSFILLTKKDKIHLIPLKE